MAEMTGSGRRPVNGFPSDRRRSGEHSRGVKADFVHGIRP